MTTINYYDDDEATERSITLRELVNEVKVLKLRVDYLMRLAGKEDREQYSVAAYLSESRSDERWTQLEIHKIYGLILQRYI